jgi:hypothetical protein
MTGQVEMKLCSRCGELYPAEHYGKRTCQCRACHRERGKLYYEANREGRNAAARANYLANKERYNERAVLWRKNNYEHYRECERDNNKLPEVRKRLADREREWQKLNPEAHKAHVLLHIAKVNGTVVPSDACSRCGTSGGIIVGHHPDYGKPLEVEWLCPKCHSFVHNNAKKEKVNV